MMASQKGHVEVVDTLLLRGASADLQAKVTACAPMCNKCVQINMYRGFYKKYIVNVELLMGEFYTYSEHIKSLSQYFMDSYTGKIFDHHYRSPKTI